MFDQFPTENKFQLLLALNFKNSSFSSQPKPVFFHLPHAVMELDNSSISEDFGEADNLGDSEGLSFRICNVLGEGEVVTLKICGIGL